MPIKSNSIKTFLFQAFVFLQTLIFNSFAEVNFPSSYIKIPDADMTFYFEFREHNKTVLMGLEIPQKVDYFAIAFSDEGNYGMSNFDLVAFVFVPDTEKPDVMNVNVNDLYSVKTGKPPSDVSLGGTDDYHLIDSYTSDKKYQVLFERAWDTKDKYDYTFNPDKTRLSIILSWSWLQNGKHSFSFHGKTAGTVIAKMHNGFQGEAKPYSPGILSPRLVLTIHGYVMLFGWGILIELALQVARYKKYSKHFISIHSFLAGLLSTVTFMSVGCALYIRWGDVSGTPSTMHYYLSWIILTLLTVQMIFGIGLKLKIQSEKVSLKISSLNKFHLVVGTSIYLITKIQVAIGFYMFLPEYMIYMFLYFGSLLFFRVYSEYNYRFQSKFDRETLASIKKENSQLDAHQKLLALLNTNTSVSKILEIPELKDIKWTILDNNVFEIKDFTHPGGNFIFNFIYGKEIGRYIYGAYGLFHPPQPSQHVHSNHALKVMERNFIGKIQNQHQILFLNSQEETSMENYFSNNLNATSQITPNQTQEKLLPISEKIPEWVLENKTILSSNIAKFEFKSKCFLINSKQQDIQLLGRHMKVSHVSQSKIRLYTLVMSQTEYRIQKRNQLWNKFQNKDILINSLPDFRSDTLPLIVKCYKIPNSLPFSEFLHNSSVGTDGFLVEGPYGHGLGLTSESTGLHYIFAAGTGILPFLDLFDYLLEDSIEDKAKGKSLFDNGFKLHVFASFSSIKDFIGLEICEKLSQLCKAKGLSEAFQLTVKAGGAHHNDLYHVTDSKFDKRFIEKNVKRESERAFVCGPPEFNELIPGQLEELGLSRKNIILV